MRALAIFFVSRPDRTVNCGTVPKGALRDAEEAALASARRAMSQLLGRLHRSLYGIRPTKWMADKLTSGGCPFYASNHVDPSLRHDP